MTTIPQLPNIVGLPGTTQALTDGLLLVRDFNEAAEKLGRKVEDDASALGFGRAQPATFDGAVDLTRHKVVTNIRATKAKLLAVSERHEQLLDAHERLWEEIHESEINPGERLQPQLPLPIARNIIQLAMNLQRQIVQTGLLQISNDPNGQSGNEVLTRLLNGCITSETLAGISTHNSTSEASQQTQVIPATQYEPALVEALTKATIEASEKKREWKDLRDEQARRIELLEEQNKDWERKASELEDNVNAFETELEEKQREIDRLNDIISTTLESGNTIMRRFGDPTGEDGNSGDEYEPEINSTQSYVEHHERNDTMMRARIFLQESDINSKNAEIERLRDELALEQENSAFYFALVETKSMEINRLNNEKDGAIATLQSEISTLNAKQLAADATAQKLQDLEQSKAVTEASLQREKEERIRTVAEANRSREQMLSNLAAVVFDKDDDLVSGLKTAIAKDNQPARRAYQPWSIESTWTKAGPYYDCDTRSTGELFVRLVSVLRAGALATDEFLVVMKKFTSIMATTSEANIAVIEWLLEACNDILGATQAMADIPAKTAVWALADVITSRWPNTERHAYDVPLFAEVLQSVRAPEADPCWDWILSIQHDGRQKFLAKQEDWPVGVLIDPTNRRCSFIQRDLVTEVDDAQIVSGEVIRIRGPDEQSFSFDLRSTKTMQWWLNW